jgi:hypothetical protein
VIRRSAWDAVGGFDPWFDPWGYVDIDFGRTLTACGWSFATVAEARMMHEPGTSTNILFREFLIARNRELFALKWSDTDPSEDGTPSIVHPEIARATRRGRGVPRHVGIDDLRWIAGRAAADALISLMPWSPNLAYASIRNLPNDAQSRRIIRDRLSGALGRRLRRT